MKSVQRCVAMTQLLVEQNFPAIAIHRGMSQEERLSRYYYIIKDTDIPNKYEMRRRLLLNWIKNKFCLMSFMKSFNLVLVFSSFRLALKTPEMIQNRIKHFSSRFFDLVGSL